MRLGNKFFFLIFFFIYNSTFAEDKIVSTPLINLNEIKPSFEESDDNKFNSIKNQKIKEKKQKKNALKSPHALLIGLDKITAKSSELLVAFNEIKKFGPLEIKILNSLLEQIRSRV